ncbi:MAG: hypothetical protein R3349_09645 [Geminicoccaceae bacterium]|nr:hypothetical protein [Geminicoccaceae bacterium]
MSGDAAPAGWAWLDGVDPADDAEAHETARRFARCFAGADGERALDHLRRAFLDRRLPPSASNAELRHLEGQRSVVAQLIALVERGRG